MNIRSRNDLKKVKSKSQKNAVKSNSLPKNGKGAAMKSKLGKIKDRCYLSL